MRATHLNWPREVPVTLLEVMRFASLAVASPQESEEHSTWPVEAVDATRAARFMT